MTANEKRIKDSQWALTERIKELECLYNVSSSIRKNNTISEILQDVVDFIPAAWQYPEITRARICFDNVEYFSKQFRESKWVQSADILVNGENKGVVEVYYIEQRPTMDEGPFLNEERRLIQEISELISETIDSKNVREELLAANQQLISANQQLQAGDQQLRASNQQLIANEQQLRAANQQLAATEQQLRATVQQLTASEKNLRDAKEKAERNEKYYHTILNKMGDLVFVKDEESRLLLVNDAFCEMFDLERSQIIGKTLAEDVTPEERESFLKIDKEVIETGKENINEESLTVRGGNNRTISTRKTRYEDDNGNKFLIGVVRDITDRKKSEIELQHAHDLMRYVIEHSNSAIAIHDRNLKYLYVSQSYLKQYQVKNENVIGKHHYDVFKDLPQKWRDVHQRALKGEVLSADNDPYEKQDGTVEWTRWECRPWFNKEGEIGGLIVYTEVITEDKKIRDAIIESELKYRTLFDSVPIGLTVADKNGKITESNKMAEELLGLSAEEQKKRKINGIEWSIIRPDGSPFPQEEYASVKALKENRLVENVEMGIVKNKEEITWISVSAVPFNFSNLGVLEAYHDITKRKKAEEQRRVSDERFLTAQNMSPDGFTILKPVRDAQSQIIDFTWVYQNSAVAKMNGTYPQNIVGKSLLELFPGHKGTKFWNAYVQVALKGKPLSFEDAYEGESITTKAWFRIVVVPMDENIAILAQDITASKMAEEKVIAANLELEKTELIAGIGGWSIDVKTMNTYLSKGVREIYEIEPERILPVEEGIKFYIPEHRPVIEKAVQECMQSGTPYELELEIITAKGNKRWVRTGGSAEIENDSIVKITGFIQDISKLKVAEIALQSAYQQLQANEQQLRASFQQLAASEQQLRANNQQLAASERELILAKETAEKSEEKFRKAIMTNPDAITINRLNDGVYILANEGFYKTFGYLKQEIIGVSSLQINIWQNVEQRNEYKNLLEKNGFIENFEAKFVSKTGKTVHCMVSSSVIELENVKHTINITKDISKIKAIESDLVFAKEKAEESEERIKNQNQLVLFNNERLESLLKISQFQTDSVQELLDFALTQAVDLTRSKIGYIYFYNEEKKQFILNTWSKEVMKECSVMNPQTVYDLDKTGCWGEAVRQRKPIIINDYQAENPLKKGTPEGHVKLEKFLTIPIIFDNKIVAVAGVANKTTDYDKTDVRQLTLLMDSVWKMSERLVLIKDLQAAKEKAEESDRLKSAFLANMSHEIRTPMNGILGFTSLLQEPDISDETKEHYIEVIQKSGDRMLNTVNDIIEISKIEARLTEVKKSEIDVSAVLKNLLDFFQLQAKQKGIILSSENKVAGLIVNTDLNKFESILTNLIKNAIKFTNDGKIDISYGVGDGFVQFCVKDTGIGVPQNRIEAIFNRFEQADIEDKGVFQGSGLGLAIAKSYVEILGGNIWVESVEGEGSTFCFTLPYLTETNKSDLNIANESTEKNEKHFNQPKILIVEDDETSAYFLKIILNNITTTIITVDSGYKAVEFCKIHSDINVVLMDIKMPGMDGFEATRRIREFNKEVIIIAQTAYALSGDKEKAIAAGCNDYITKPIKQNQLFELITKHLTK